MKLYLLIAILLVSIFIKAYSQDVPLTTIANTPSKEIYDLLEDRKGFIWVADNLGVRRFDGVSFTAFTNPAQSSISMSGLCEDKLGRIWCHNFSGQIFYIEHEKMHLLEGYKFALERDFPRMALCGDELVATSSRGIFTCNINTLQCRYISMHSGATTLTVVGEKIILFGDSTWHVYQKGKGIRKIQVNKNNFANADLTSIILYSASNNGTIYASSYPNTDLYLFSYVDDQIKLIDIRKYKSFINTVTVKKDEVWIHTKTQSISLKDAKTITGYNLSCILSDRQGNRWFSSLEKGLWVEYAGEKRTAVRLDSLQNGDFVRCVKQGKGYFVSGTQQGKILITDSSCNVIAKYSLPAGAGAVEKIQLIGEDSFYIACSVGLYVVQPSKHLFWCINKVVLARDVSVVDNSLFLATPRGLLHPTFTRGYNTEIALGNEIFHKYQRCRAVIHDSLLNCFFIAYSDGLYKLQNNQLTAILDKGKPIYASSLEYNNGKVYVGTYGGNLIIIQGGNLTKIKLQDVAISGGVLRMKLCNHHLWILKTSGVSVFDIDNERFIYNRQVAYLNGSDIYDVEETNAVVYFSTAESLYKIQMQDGATIEPPSLYLLYATINNRDTIFKNDTKLSPAASNISFYLAIPWLHNSNNVNVRYSLFNSKNTNNDSTQWYYLEPNERIIQFNSLKPGSYTLKIEAGINGDFQYSVSRISYDFKIRKHWYNHWWFYLFFLSIFTLLFYVFYKYRIQQLTKIEKLRRQISSDLHDDIGSTISSINIYSQLIKRGQNPLDYIDIIQANTVQVINNLDDVVWNINPKNDTLAQLINRMKLFALPYLEDNHIQCSFDLAIEKENKILSPEIRVDCYLVLKEAINNIVKHAACTVCSIHLYQKKKELRLTITDNGKGFQVNEAALHRNGLTTMRLRAKQLKGRLVINSSPENGTEIILSCHI